MAGERPFIQSDIAQLGSARRKPYEDIINAQISKFPKGMNLRKTSIPDMQKLLLDPRLGFTTIQPLAAIPSPGVREHASPSPSQTSVPPSGSDLPPSIIIVFNPYTTLTFEFLANSVTPRQTRAVQLLIQDSRGPSGISNVSQRVLLAFADAEDCDNGEWRASSSEVFSELQASFGRLQGAGKIGIPDREDNKYTEFFVTFNSAENEQVFAPSMSNIIIPRTNRLELRVEHHPNLLPTSSQTKTEMIPAESNSPRSTSTLPKIPDDAVKWLQEKIEKRTGYATFNSNRNKVLQNRERVEFWKFAAQVVTMFHKTAWPSSILSISSTKTITMDAIQKALRIGATTLNDAVKMTRIVEIYTREGPNYSEEVDSETRKAEEPLENVGASTLMAFLQQWAGNHPIVEN
ncbi:hypothetical protein R3P38DRAFT_3566747 [Favolaschia claudopus]|uniref:Uncharacterized protein n=1 Tax=Favolaschia claudopus TaxID=2862362 RepID=A0AAW0DY27_9AGAR